MYIICKKYPYLFISISSWRKKYDEMKVKKKEEKGEKRGNGGNLLL